MASLGTLALGTFTNVSNTAITGTDPVLEVIGSTDDADFVRDTANSDHTSDCWFDIATTLPADLTKVDTLSINLRYGLDTTKGTNDWLFLRARVFKSDGSTALTDLLTVVDGGTGISNTTPANSGAVAFAGVDTTATKAEWQAAQVHIYFVINRDGGGDSVVERVYAAELTGTYTADTSDDLTADDLNSGTPTLGSPAIGQVHTLNAGDVSTPSPTLTSAVIGQKHVITADDLASGTPTLTSPALGITHPLLAEDIASGTPTLTAAALGQVHTLTADDIATPAPTLTSPAIGQAHVLAADSIATGTPTLTEPALTSEGAVVAETPVVVWGRGGEWTTKKKRRYSRPFYYYQAQYPEVLAKLAEPADADTFDATIKAAAAIESIMRRLDDDDRAFDQMLSSIERTIADTTAYVKSAKVQRMLDETVSFIKAAKDAEIRQLMALEMAEAQEIEELMQIL